MKLKINIEFEGKPSDTGEVFEQLFASREKYLAQLLPAQQQSLPSAEEIARFLPTPPPQPAALPPAPPPASVTPPPQETFFEAPPTPLPHLPQEQVWEVPAELVPTRLPKPRGRLTRAIFNWENLATLAFFVALLGLTALLDGKSPVRVFNLFGDQKTPAKVAPSPKAKPAVKPSPTPNDNFPAILK